ncbi:MAG: phospholipid/cholesterol/gamma-HCH transport system substrate-binding protein [Actinomycetota bacterium]|nr:phospholipid/cholesterol/gamma-HCH transport system substrate-binding protein [Actinomycetota bacterium]MEA2486557.1 phospholipid/cholesterol/gamma-HCH transport system substrate-binding protein [Actinomycetota bacterium]
MKRFIKPLSTTIVLLLLAGAAGLYYNAHRKPSTYQVTAYFVKTIGLYPHSDVDVLGVPIGKVSEITPVGSQVKVVLQIEDRYKVPANANAQIVPPSLISDRYVQLTPAYQSGPALADGAVLHTDRTQIPAELDDVYAQLKKLLDTVKPGRPGAPGPLGTLVKQLNLALHDREGQLQSTLVSASDLTQTLAGARGHLSGLLVNLDQLFTKIATRAGEIGSLNSNFANVLTALHVSRADLRGTLQNLAGVTGEVGSLVRQQGNQLGGDLGLAARVLAKVLKHRASVSESLSWLPVVAVGLGKAFHGGANHDVDVRDSNTQRLECTIVDAVPPGPVKDQLEKLCKQVTGPGPTPPPLPTPLPTGTAPAPTLPQLPSLPFNCHKAVKKVKHEIHRLNKLGLPPPIKKQVLKPLAKNIKKIAKKCKSIEQKIKHPGGLIDKIKKAVGNIPNLPANQVPDIPGVTGNALAGPAVPTIAHSPSLIHRVGSFFGNVLGFLGWGS